MSRECIVQVEGVWTAFRGVVVHEDITLCLRRGEILGLVGGSGSGKTTLLREMLGLQRPTRGEIYMFGQPLGQLDMAGRRQLRNRCGVLFQGGALFSALTLFDNIALPLRELRLFEEEMVRQLVGSKLRMVGLGPETAQLLPAELSGGMVKRASLARALALDPELLLLDEPTSGLDPTAGESFVQLVKSLHRTLGLSILMITHDLDTLVDLCHQVAVLADHRLVAVGTLEDVRASTHPFARRFFHGLRAQRVFGEGERAPE